MKYFRILGMMIITMLITIPVFAKQSIKLDGKWSKSERSLETDLPIHAWVEDSNEHISLFFEDDLGDVLDRIQALNSDKCAYTSYSGKANGMDGSVKFIIETAAIEAAEE